VLGGLIGSNIRTSENKIPFLGDIPLLGRLFRSEGSTAQKTNLLVFITPHIIRDGKDLSNITRRNQQTGQRMQTEALRRSIPPGTLFNDLPAPPTTEESP
ncbi:MAG: type II secretion system protein GspD, partial [Deltaproteobacteria bacterium]